MTITDSRGGKSLNTTTKTFTYTKKEEKEYSITASTEQVLYDPTTDVSEVSSSFDFMYIVSSGGAEIEVECDTGAEVGREQITFSLQADVPFILGSDVSRAGIVAFDGFAGTLDVVDKIVAKAGVADIVINVVLAK